VSQTEAQARAAMSYAHQRWLEPPDTEDELPSAPCPLCGQDTLMENYGCDGDCSRKCRGHWHPAKCEECSAECNNCCDEVGLARNGFGYCFECAAAEYMIDEEDE
jgi:hypothetical protein